VSNVAPTALLKMHEKLPHRINLLRRASLIFSS
jgi:hypothetical protein